MGVGDKVSVGRARNIIGQTFGPFTVLYRCEYKNDRPYWKVKCNNCGTEDIRRGSDLINKSDKLTCSECGRIDNKAGKKFGLLTVSKEWKRKNKMIYWKCICECGKETWVKAGNLTSGEVKSCGCLSGKNQKIKKEKRKIDWAKLKPGDKIPIGKAIDLTDKKFKKLTALYRCIPPETYSEKERDKAAFWMCKCDCGNYIIVKSYELQFGGTCSCGCYNKELNKEKIKKIHQKYRQERIEKIQGQQFGLLTALYPTEERKNRYMVWHCQCECGNTIDVRSSDLIEGRKYSCGCITGSLGEQKIHHFLFNKNIDFIREKTFDDGINPKTKYKFRFDFYLPKYNCCIEFDGEQHFKETNMCQNTLKERQEIDNIKNSYCSNKNIRLIRISYRDINNIETILQKQLNL